MLTTTRRNENLKSYFGVSEDLTRAMKRLAVSALDEGQVL
jgi:hypothetical protein